jgi:hypothetical protein
MVSGEVPPVVIRHGPGILRAAGFGGRRVAGVSRLAGGSKKGVYRLACDDGFSVVLYVWSAAEDYWPAEPDGDDTGVFGHASGLGLFEASGRELAAAGVRVPEVYLLDRSRAVYPADIAVVEDVRGGTLESLLETDPAAAIPVVERLGAMLTPMWGRRSGRVGKVADVVAADAMLTKPAAADSVRMVLDRALRHLAEAADRVPEVAGARQRLNDRLHELAAATAPRAGYALIHGELGPDHVLLDARRMPVVVDIEGAMYFDAEWEHAFLRLRFGRHYQRLALPGLDERRMSLYALALDLSLIAGPLRLLDGGYPDREPMLAIAGWAIDRALLAASETRLTGSCSSPPAPAPRANPRGKKPEKIRRKLLAIAPFPPHTYVGRGGEPPDCREEVGGSPALASLSGGGGGSGALQGGTGQKPRSRAGNRGLAQGASAPLLRAKGRAPVAD